MTGAGSRLCCVGVSSRRCLCCARVVGIGPTADPGAAGDKPSLVDLLIAVELEQLRLLSGESRPTREAGGMVCQQRLAAFPAVRDLLCRVAEFAAPHYDDVHALLRKGAGKPPAAQPTSKL